MHLLCWLLACAFLVSCANNSLDPTIIPQDSLVQDGTLIIDTSNIATDTITNVIVPNGIYSATIKCKGCQTTEQTVAFLSGRNYRMEEKYHGDRNFKKTSGTWTPSNGTIWLYEDQVVKARYVWEGDTLYYRHANGDKTRMEKRPAATDNDVWRKKGKEGLEFYGVGNEPFWNIDIDEQKSIRFQLADWDKPMEFNAVKPTITADSLIYITGNNAELVRITIYNTFCSDGMSDYVYNNRVVVRFNGTAYEGCGILFRR